jgi:tRNA A58 N-methylase Trm61
MGEYVLNHHREGEGKRLALMSQLLDPMQRRYIESLNIGPGARTLEVGCGNGSISEWLAQRVAPGAVKLWRSIWICPWSTCARRTLCCDKARL